MKPWFGILTIFAFALCGYAQPVPPPKIDSLIDSEIQKFQNNSTHIVFNSSPAALVNKLKSIKAMHVARLKQVVYKISIRDSFVCQTWTSQDKLNPTKKIQFFTQTGSFNDAVSDIKSGATIHNVVYNKLCVHFVRIVRSQKPYLIEIESPANSPLDRLKFGKAEYLLAYEDVLVGLSNAYALLNKNIMANK